MGVDWREWWFGGGFVSPRWGLRKEAGRWFRGLTPPGYCCSALSGLGIGCLWVACGDGWAWRNGGGEALGDLPSGYFADRCHPTVLRARGERVGHDIGRGLAFAGCWLLLVFYAMMVR